MFPRMDSKGRMKAKQKIKEKGKREFCNNMEMAARKEIYLYIWDGFNFIMVSEVIMKDIHKELLFIRRKLEELEEIILPTEKLSEEEIEEIRKLREQSVNGEHIKWDELKEKSLPRNL